FALQSSRERPSTCAKVGAFGNAELLHAGGHMKPVFVSSVLAVALLGFTGHAVAQDGRGAAPPAPAAQAARGAQPTPPCGPNLTIKNVDKESRCFELRTYTVREGSSIDLLHSRFRDHTTALFKKHGMTVVGYWH